MAMPIYTEIETGTSTGWIHHHNGYYAGDFFGTATATTTSAG